MMRGEKETVIPVPPNSPAIVPSRNKLAAANIIDPQTGSVIYHVITTKYFNIGVAAICTLILAGVVFLGLILYLKSDVDQNTRQLEQIRREGLIKVNENNNK